MDWIRELPSVKPFAGTADNIDTNNTDQLHYSEYRKGIQSQASVWKVGNTVKLSLSNHHQRVAKESEKDTCLEAPFKIPYANGETGDQESFDADSITFDAVESKPTPLVPPTRRRDLNKTRDLLSTKEVLDQNKVILRFLDRKTEEGDIITAFKRFGDILRIEFHGVKQNFFKHAVIYFKTKEGMHNALQTTDLLVKNISIVMEPASSFESMRKNPIPNLIHPAAPAALVKNPRRTVAIKQLTDEISSHHIKEALAFCESKISGFFFCSSSLVAYVEFETEEGKERALAKSSIFVLGKCLYIFRIDVPRTTVVRISNVPPESEYKELD